MENVLLTIFYGLNGIYFFSLLTLLAGEIRLLRKNDLMIQQAGDQNVLPISVLIPFRNESESLLSLLHSLGRLHYPVDKLELLFLNDSSTDDSLSKVHWFLANSPFLGRVIPVERKAGESPKKIAITQGVMAARFEHVIVLDADCEVGENWLHSYSRIWKITDADFLPGVVMIRYQEPETPFKRIQALEFAGWIAMGLGLAGLNRPFLCNGANMGFKKSAFLEIGGYEGNLHIHSGDDVFLLEKMQESGKKIFYNTDPAGKVVTEPAQTVASFLLQRSRWGGKNFKYRQKWKILFQIPFYLYFLMFYIVLIISGLKGVLIWFLGKSAMDALLVFPFLKKYDRDGFLLRSLMITEIFQIFYLPVTGILVMLHKKDWQ